MTRSTPFLAAALILFSPALSHAESSHTKVDLIAEKTSIKAGQDMVVGVRFKMEKGWHVYWLNPGDSGLAPTVSWNLPKGFSVEALHFPVPDRLPLPQLMDYGYEREVTLVALMHVSPDLKTKNPIKLSAKVRFLACKDICVPGEENVKLVMKLRHEVPTDNSKNRGSFARARGRMPLQWPSEWKTEGHLKDQEIRLNFLTPLNISKAWFIPRHSGRIENAAPQKLAIGSGMIQLTLKRSEQLKEIPASMDGLLVLEESGSKDDKGYNVDVPLTP